MPQRRHGEPLPLGNADLPYSKGVMARALIAVGVPADRAYSLARRVEVDLAERNERTVDPARLRVLRTRRSAKKKASVPWDSCSGWPTCRRWTCRSSC